MFICASPFKFNIHLIQENSLFDRFHWNHNKCARSFQLILLFAQRTQLAILIQAKILENLEPITQYVQLVTNFFF